MTRLLGIGVLLIALAATAALPRAAGAGDLLSYIAKPEHNFKWEVMSTHPLPGGSAAIIRVISQVWHDIRWEHWVTVIVPDEIKHADDALLVIAGGSKRASAPENLPNEAMLLLGGAAQTGTVVAILNQVPYQPLFDNLREDALIAHTFKKVLETKDETWALLLPMTRSAVRTMDALQAFLTEKQGRAPKRFFVTGASKRGWTTWLTAAADPRVSGIAPMVFDVVNFPLQMPHQVQSFGKYSEQIKDYTLLGLPQRLADDPEASRLAALVDPYTYRDRLTMPKLIVLGTNDPYWPIDAIKLYFNDLKGEKYIHYVPNAGHGLGPGALEATSAFYNTIVAGEARPRFTWKMQDEGTEAVLTIQAEDAPEGVELWSASAKDRDFRKSRWTSVPVQGGGKDGRWTVRVPLPEAGYVAFYAALTYGSSLGHDYKLCTNVEIVSGRTLLYRFDEGR
jgi:PhoPQ-activated pathogenicity-related protein